jgi:hypothetical protein
MVKMASLGRGTKCDHEQAPVKPLSEALDALTLK